MKRDRVKLDLLSITSLQGVNTIDPSAFSPLCLWGCKEQPGLLLCGLIHVSLSILCLSLSLSFSPRTPSLAVSAQSAARWGPGAKALCLNYLPNESLGKSLGLLVPPSLPLVLFSLSHPLYLTHTDTNLQYLLHSPLTYIPTHLWCAHISHLLLLLPPNDCSLTHSLSRLLTGLHVDGWQIKGKIWTFDPCSEQTGL